MYPITPIKLIDTVSLKIDNMYPITSIKLIDTVSFKMVTRLIYIRFMKVVRKINGSIASDMTALMSSKWLFQAGLFFFFMISVSFMRFDIHL